MCLITCTTMTGIKRGAGCGLTTVGATPCRPGYGNHAPYATYQNKRRSMPHINNREGNPTGLNLKHACKPERVAATSLSPLSPTQWHPTRLSDYLTWAGQCKNRSPLKLPSTIHIH